MNKREEIFEAVKDELKTLNGFTDVQRNRSYIIDEDLLDFITVEDGDTEIIQDSDDEENISALYQLSVIINLYLNEDEDENLNQKVNDLHFIIINKICKSQLIKEKCSGFRPRFSTYSDNRYNSEDERATISFVFDLKYYWDGEI